MSQPSDNTENPDTDVVLVPIQLQAFVLNSAVCGRKDEGAQSARIIPITQPNYTFLRLDNFVIQTDVLSHADLHSTIPAEVNPRLYDLSLTETKKTTPRRNRWGVYVQWTLPRMYRTGVISSDDVTPERAEQERLRAGLPPRTGKSAGTLPSQTPEFAKPPTRWIVVRHLDQSKPIEPAQAKDILPEYQAWVIESDTLRLIDQISPDTDLQVDVSPFVVGLDGKDVDGIKRQAEVFIGRKTPLEKWQQGPSATVKDLTLLMSGNPLFADFQLHNSNVFSMLDNFQYGTTQGKPQYLQQATASYYLFGWHSEQGKSDPLNQVGNHRERIAALMMSIKSDGNTPEAQPWLDTDTASRILCHGAMYDVVWNQDTKPLATPVDNFASRLSDPTIPAVSVGTTPMDSLITYCTARKPVNVDPKSVPTLEEDILAIDSLLHARDDGVEGQREAKDMVYNWNFDRSSGGLQFHVGSSDDQDNSLEWGNQTKIDLRALNRCQSLLNSCQRSLIYLRWMLFALWWEYVSDVSNLSASNKDDAFKGRKGGPDDIQSRIVGLEKIIDDLEEEKEKFVPVDPADKNDPPPSRLIKNVKKATSPFYYRSRDPTVLIGGIKSGWPKDYLDNVKVRLPSQIVESSSPVPSTLLQLATKIQNSGAFDSALASAATRLLSEFFNLSSANSGNTILPAGKSYPQFHDNNIDTEDTASDGQVRYRDQWGNKQPWFPLYVEWEVEYTHIPFEWWSLGAKAKRLSDNKLVRYGIRDPTTENGVTETFALDEKLEKTFGAWREQRILSGRTIILPQPSFSLKAKVEQLLQDTPPQILDKYLDQADRDVLSKQIGDLAFLSAPLSGLTDGLVTLCQGTHIKPENKTITNGTELVDIVNGAIFKNAGLDAEALGRIEGNSALTPYAAKTNFMNEPFNPFKPVTHGQFRFRKLNVIDKFGQAITALDPRASNTEPEPLWPCISDFYEPEQVEGPNSEANTVRKSANSHCEYMQIPPQINQPARLNGEFVVQTSRDVAQGDDARLTSYWRPTTEFDNPIWGWVVVNYADFGLQFFLPDGTFYREVRYGGPNGALVEPKWVPFAHSDDTDPVIDPKETDPVKISLAKETIGRVAQLDALIDKLQSVSYLKSFWKMIITAQHNLPPPPDAYAQYLSSIVGKPFAMANMGWWLELASEPYQNQSTRVNARPRFKPKQLSEYEFQVKFGDVEREYDGLVGYFDVAPVLNDQNQYKELNLDGFYTYLQKIKPPTSIPEEGTTTQADDNSSNSDMESEYYSTTSEPDKQYPNLIPLSTANYPKFKAVHVSPEPQSTDSKVIADVIVAHESARNNNLQVYGAIFDPFTPIHAYSSLLPASSLKLPPWTWQAAMNNMTAFFHAGPMTVVKDVNPYDSHRLLKPDNWQLAPPLNVALPALGIGDWNWLQPYVDPTHDDPTKESDLLRAPVFNSYGIEKRGDVGKPGFEKGPYTAIEGFLQLRNPIMKEKPGKK